MSISINTFINKHPWFCLGAALLFFLGFQCLNLFYGLDLYDTGFHLVAYENVFDAPNSVYCNFMYYLTNLIGGTFLRMFPDMGILGFRLMGAGCVIATLAIIFASLKKEISPVHILLGSALVVVSYVRSPYAFNNGILSCCLYAIAIILLYKGLTKKMVFLLIMSGIIVGVNIFSRIPNVLGVGMVMVVLFHKKLYNKEKGLDWKNACLFLVGVCLGISFVLLLMIQLGHFEVFMHSMKVVFSLAGGNGSHSLLCMMKIHVAFYLAGIIPVLVFYALFHIDETISYRTSRFVKLVFYVVAILSVFLYVYETTYVYTIIWGMCVIGCIICIIRHQKESIGVLAALALFMLIVEIYGSDTGVNHGSLPALLAAPVASSQLLNKRRMIYILTFVLAVGWQIIRKGNFQDVGPIYQKTEHIYIPEAKHIFTTPEKANVINSTLEGLRPYVTVGDTMMCFPLAPMMNYLTHTRPAGGSCWIGENGTFPQPLQGTPKILFNKTFLSGENWYEIYNIDSPFGFDIKTFIGEHQYQKVYENSCFILYVP